MAVTDSAAQNYQLQDPDVRLMLQVRNDNAAAFEELVVKYHTRLVSILEHLVHGRELAEDLAQDVFLRVYRARKRYEPGSKFSTWLFTIANRVASNALRSRARRREVNVASRRDGEETVKPLDQMAVAKSGWMPTRQADKLEKAEIVRLALESLGERQKMAILLSKFEGLSYVEIAEAMGLSVQALKSLLSRARVNLKAILEPYIAEGTLPTATGQPLN